MNNKIYIHCIQLCFYSEYNRKCQQSYIRIKLIKKHRILIKCLNISII